MAGDAHLAGQDSITPTRLRATVGGAGSRFPSAMEDPLMTAASAHASRPDKRVAGPGADTSWATLYRVGGVAGLLFVGLVAAWFVLVGFRLLRLGRNSRP